MTFLSLFKVNYGKEPRIGFEIRKKKKYVKAEEFVKKMKEMYKEVKAVLRKSQEKMKKYVDRKKEAKEYKVGNRVCIHLSRLLFESKQFLIVNVIATTYYKDK